MPFVMMCGLPSSGKSHYAKLLKDHLEKSRGVKCYRISDEDFFEGEFGKNQVYSESGNEKELRASLKSEVQKLMSKEDVVILDSSNYIKGYRYELFCISKLTQTPQCVIYVDRKIDDCIQLNASRPENESYKVEVMNALNMRFEAPETKNRWDSTLFTITPTNSDSDQLPIEAIENVLFNQKAPPPNKSTLNKPLSDTTFLHDIDKTTQEILTYILNLQSNQLASNEVTVPGATEKVKLIRPVTLAELRKWRQQFLTYIKMHPPSDASKISNMFVEYINNLIL